MKLLTIQDIATSVPLSYSYVVLLNDLARQFVIAEYMTGVLLGTLAPNKAINPEQLQAEAMEIDDRIRKCPYLRDALKSMLGQSTFDLRIVEPPPTDTASS